MSDRQSEPRDALPPRLPDVLLPVLLVVTALMGTAVAASAILGVAVTSAFAWTAGLAALVAAAWRLLS